ncbi:MAG: DNA polymerase III subunit gamma/tau [Deltaproteobacteria bacterium]|nr:DNA polymerase III subunit gamma/tau [Deltaproteobacteria bacterium]
MAYLGLARKWRPQTFDDLVGQAHISRTISNAIKTGRVSQGYLFTGTRGIGKTSAARIFAKAIRCPTAGTTGVPCNSCNDCRQISEGKSIDVLEIDGASNNGVDDVREIRDAAKYLPSSGKYRIYIIDEVHMLTTAAFNAMLKTLEEPPAHVIFIFATTDPQKIPATVLSRCQRFDFKRVSQKDLAARLKFICDSEKVTINTDALTTLAREAEGSMRDAVSLLDQILAVGGVKITGESVTEALGLVDKQTVLDCVTGILKRKPLAAVEAVGKVHLHGFDLKQFGREILRCLRQLMVARLLEQNSQNGLDLKTYMDLSDVDIADLKSLLHERSLDDLDMLFRLLNHGLEDVARSAIPKMVMDVLVIKMASSEELISLADIKSPESIGGSGGGSRSETGKLSAAQPAVTQGQPAVAHSLPQPVQTAQPARARASELLAALASPPPSPAPPASEDKPTIKQAFAQTREDNVKIPLEAPRGLHDASSWVKIVAAIKAQRPLVGSILEHLSMEGIVDANGTTEAMRATQQLLGAKLEKLDISSTETL